MKNKKGKIQGPKHKTEKTVNLPPGLIEVSKPQPSEDLIAQQNKYLETILTSREKEFFNLTLANATKGQQ